MTGHFLSQAPSPGNMLQAAVKPTSQKMPGRVSGLRSLLRVPMSTHSQGTMTEIPCHAGWGEALSSPGHFAQTWPPASVYPMGQGAASLLGPEAAGGSTGGSLVHTQSHFEVLLFSQCLQFSLKRHSAFLNKINYSNK